MITCLTFTTLILHEWFLVFGLSPNFLNLSLRNHHVINLSVSYYDHSHIQNEKKSCVEVETRRLDFCLRFYWRGRYLCTFLLSVFLPSVNSLHYLRLPPMFSVYVPTTECGSCFRLRHMMESHSSFG